MSIPRLGAITLLLPAGLLSASLLSASTAMAAPVPYQFELGPVARTNTTKLLAVGEGGGNATLDGGKLTVSGKFQDLISPATDAHLCVGIGIGIPGTCFSDLTVSKDQEGTVSGTVTLNAKQLAALPAGQLYIQINSVKAPAPAGNLWGWILVPHEDMEPDVPQEGHWFMPQYDMPKSVEHGSTHDLKPDANS